MTRAKTCARTALALCAMVSVTGCDLFGAREVRVSREDYNESVQASSARQLLTNVVRVYYNEIPLSMDVTGLIPTYTGNATLGGSLSGLGIGKKGGAFRTGSLTSGGLTAGLSYTQSLTAQYAPISGAALVQEFTTPIAPELIPKLIDAVVPTLPVLLFAVSRMTPKADDFPAALNLISELDNMQAIDIAAAPETEPPKQNPSIATNNLTVTVNDSTAKQAKIPSLALFFQPPRKCYDFEVRLWEELLGLYADTQSNIKSGDLKKLKDRTAKSGCDKEGELHVDLDGIEGAKRIILSPAATEQHANSESRAVTEQHTNSGSGSDLVPRIFSTYSAYGILRAVRESYYNPPEIFSVVSRDLYNRIRKEEPWNQKEGQVYTLLYRDICGNGNEPLKCDILTSSETVSIDCTGDGQCCAQEWISKPKEDTLNEFIDNTICKHYHAKPQGSLPLFYIDDPEPSRWPETQSKLSLRRRLILIQMAADPPERAFLSVERGGNYFFIGEDDEISQRNFALLALLVAVQAVAPATPQATPTVPVGGR